MNSNQRGFSPIVIAVALVIVGVAGFTSYAVYKNQQNEPVANASSKTIEPKNSGQQSEPKNSVGLTQANKDSIIASVQSYCKNTYSTDTVKVDGANLDNPQFTKVKDNFVSASLFCEDPSRPSEDQGSGRRYLLEQSEDTWQVILASQMDPDCSAVDGKGIPAGLIMCADENTPDNKLREPR